MSLGWLHGVPGGTGRRPGGLGRVVGLSSFDQATPVKIDGIPRPVSAPAADPATFRRVKIAHGKRGTDETLNAMAELAIEASQDPYFVEFARSIVRDCPSRDEECVLTTVLEWAAEHIKYNFDPMFMEWVQSPGWLAFVSGEGDCDDLSCFIVAVLLALGRSAGFKAVAVERGKPDEYSHVFAWGVVNGRKVALDAVMRPPRLGQEPPASAYVMEPNLLAVA